MTRSISSKAQVGSSKTSTKSFGTILILAAHSAFNARYKLYENSEQVANDFSTDHPIYKAANTAFDQELSPEEIAIGRRDDTGAVAQVDTLTIDDAALSDGDTLTVTFENRELEVEYDASGSADADEAADQVVDAINAEEWPVTAATTGTLGEYTVTADLAGQPFDLTTGGGHSNSTTSTANSTPDESVTDALTAIEGVFPEWYGLALCSRTDADITDASTYVEGKRKKFLACSNASDILGSGTSDVFATLKGLSHKDSGGFFHTRPWYFPDVALLANRLSISPDDQSATWADVELVGVPTESITDLTPTERNNLDSKNVTYYTEEVGLGATENGKVFVGEWWDVMIGIDWFNARLEERAYSIKHSAANDQNTGKLSYTNADIGKLEQALRDQISNAQDTDLIALNPPATLDVPNALDVDSSQRGSRELPPITWDARLAGAIHFADFSGTLIP